MRQQLLNPLVELRLGHVRHAPVKTQVVLRAEPLVKTRVFQQRAGAGTNLVALRSRIETEHLRAAAGRFDQAEQQPDGRRLACAIGSEEAEHRARRNLQREIVQRSNLLESPRQPLCADCKFCHPI